MEVNHLSDVEAAAIEIIREYRIQEAKREYELRNWKLAMTDSEGAVILLLPVLSATGTLTGSAAAQA